MYAPLTYQVTTFTDVNTKNKISVLSNHDNSIYFMTTNPEIRNSSLISINKEVFDQFFLLENFDIITQSNRTF